MFLFDLLFGKKKNSASPAGAATAVTPAASAPVPAYAPGTRIQYDAELIALLKQDHRRLLGTFQSISAASMAGEWLAVESLLAQFKALIQDHLLKENVRLYVYLEHRLENDAASHKMMHGFRHEMDGIGKVVVGFLEKYQGIGAQRELTASFAKDLGVIGEALSARIGREETVLYPMYA